MTPPKKHSDANIKPNERIRQPNLNKGSVGFIWGFFQFVTLHVIWSLHFVIWCPGNNIGRLQLKNANKWVRSRVAFPENLHMEMWTWLMVCVYLCMSNFALLWVRNTPRRQLQCVCVVCVRWSVCWFYSVSPTTILVVVVGGDSKIHLAGTIDVCLHRARRYMISI